MVPPYWIDENGQRVPTEGCPRPGCDREYPLHRYRLDTLRLLGWQLYRVASFINWCGHRQEILPVPEDGGWVRCIPVIGQGK